MAQLKKKLEKVRFELYRLGDEPIVTAQDAHNVFYEAAAVAEAATRIAMRAITGEHGSRDRTVSRWSESLVKRVRKAFGFTP